MNERSVWGQMLHVSDGTDPSLNKTRKLRRGKNVVVVVNTTAKVMHDDPSLTDNKIEERSRSYLNKY